MSTATGRWLAAGLVFLLAALVVAALVVARRHAQQEFRTVGVAAAAIRRDLPKGTPRGKVQNWLDARGIDRSSNAQPRQEIALLHDVRKDEVSRTDLRMVFTFDQHDQLETFLVEELTTARHNDERRERIRD